MANYEFRVLSNSFETKNNDEVKSVFEKLGFEVDEDGDNLIVYSDEVDYSDGMVVVRDENNKVIGAFNSYDKTLVDYTYELNEEDTIYTITSEGCTLQDLDQYVQEMLVENDTNYFALKEVGHEKFRYVDGWVLIITPYHIQGYNLDMLIEKFVKKSLESKGNEHFDEERGDV